MKYREAVEEDGEVIREIAQRSMEASYSLSPGTIESAVGKWYDSEMLAQKFDDEEALLFVAERDGEPVAFSESVLVDGIGDVLWIHVDPAYRTEGIGIELFDRTVDTLREAGADTIRGRVLADNVAGNSFYEDRGLTKVGEDTVEIDDAEYVENVYVLGDVPGLDPIVGPDGEELFVDLTDVSRGSLAPIHPVYADTDGEMPYGYFCSNCDSAATSMDSMGRIQCSNCGNHSKPTRWDAAYL